MESIAKKYLGNKKWYHGTTLFGWKQICELGIRYDHNIGNELDFGHGFYLTHKKKDAEKYILKLLEYTNMTIEIPLSNENVKNKKVPVVIEFEFIPFNWYGNGYMHKFLTTYNSEFAEFVFHNRVYNLNGENQHEFDFIFGAMSDSVPTVLIQQFKEGTITRNSVIDGLKKNTSNKQLSLHNQELCDMIKPLRVCRLDTEEELDINEYSRNR